MSRRQYNDDYARGARDRVDARGARDPVDPRGARDRVDPRGARDPVDPRGARDPVDSRGARERIDPRDIRRDRDGRDAWDSRDPRDPRDLRDPRDIRDPRDVIDSYSRRMDDPMDMGLDPRMSNRIEPALSRGGMDTRMGDIRMGDIRMDSAMDTQMDTRDRRLDNRTMDIGMGAQEPVVYREYRTGQTMREAVPASRTQYDHERATRYTNEYEPPQRFIEYFIPGDGINREVIQVEICKFLGPDATVRPGTNAEVGPKKPQWRWPVSK